MQAEKILLTDVLKGYMVSDSPVPRRELERAVEMIDELKMAFIREVHRRVILQNTLSAIVADGSGSIDHIVSMAIEGLIAARKDINENAI